MNKTALLIFLLLSTNQAFAELHDIGGKEAEFKGDGDLVPPLCQLDIPTASTEPFSVKWNCTDNVSPDNEIRTELWLLRNGASHAVKIKDFLGFPAAANIDAETLKSTTIAEGLPAAFRLVARDRAGAGIVSPYFTVTSQNIAATKCSLTLTRAATDSTETGTGSPTTSLKLEDIEVNTNTSTSGFITYSTKSETIAGPCEIAAICDETDSGAVTFTATVSTESSSTGTLTVSPGNFEAEISGTSSSLTGTGTLNEVSTEVELVCTE